MEWSKIINHTAKYPNKVYISPYGDTLGTKCRDREYRIHKVQRRLARGQTVQEIADALEMRRQIVISDIKILEEMAGNIAKRAASDHLGKQIMRLEEMYRSSWEAFLLSQGDSLVTTIRSDKMKTEIDKKTGEKRQVPVNPKSTMTRKKQAGDPRFMAQAAWAWDRYSELFGLISKQGGKTGNQIDGQLPGEIGMVVYMPTNGRDMHLQQNKTSPPKGEG